MQTIPVAMSWELLQRGRWSLPAFAALAFSMPVLILAALTAERWPADDPSSILIHVMLVQWNLLIFGFAVFSAQGRTSPLYAMPARTSALVAWRLAPAMAAMALEMAAFIGTLNLLFGLDWPIGGPALHSAAAMACVRAAFWLTERSRWSVAALTVVAAAVCLWFKSRYGPMFGTLTHMWDGVTTAEAFTMLGAAAAAYWVSVVGVARNRRGEAPYSLGIWAGLDRWLDQPSRDPTAFRGATGAQTWAEWQRKGRAMPLGVVYCLAIGMVIWLFTSRDSGELIDGFFGGGCVLLMLGFIGGLIFGNTGPNDSSFEMGSFLATRPMTSAELARILLRTAAGSLLLSWALWIAAFLATIGVVAAAGADWAIHFPEGLSWWYFPATLAGAWTILGCWMMIGLVGHSRMVLWSFVVAATSLILVVLVSKWALEPEAQRVLGLVLWGAVGVALVVGTAWAYATALRRQVVEPLAAAAAGLTWTVASGLAVVLLPPAPAASYLILSGVFALATAPLAVAPLAVAWNRHR